MKYGRVLSFKDIEEAKKLIGKKVVCSDYFQCIEEHPECERIGSLKDIKCGVSYVFKVSIGSFQFIREVTDVPELMTNRQLAEWIAKGNGEYAREDSGASYSAYGYDKTMKNVPVSDNLRIRTWDSEEWVIPTVDIYERDCK